MTDDGAGRREELAANLVLLRERIAAACATAGRDPSELTTIAITKTRPASDVRLLAALGVTDVGENRDQEAAAKHGETTDLGLRWHFVGQLQRNKCRSVASYVDVVHSVDRAPLVSALSRAAVDAGRELSVLIQVSLDDHATGRGGAKPDDVAPLAAAVAAAAALELGGVMAVAPLGAPAEPAFAHLASVAERLRADHPAATIISAGMTGDLEAAVAAGATHLRIGTALLGGRAAVLG
jgi:pyridoxal phosphate enzyme (YggS family)